MGELLDKITEKILRQIDGAGFQQEGAFNLRHNGIALCHGDSEHIKIKKKEDRQGIDIFIDGETKGGTGAYSGSGRCLWNEGCGL
ncbi:hypothetical protein IMSAGC018_00127 [Lachnospiraceae bacterium]|nr:hypothetical protein IMSAGC018_00127 [Lachnospiraceae bacterium]